MAIVEWEYYSSLYSKISESEFEKAETLAEKEVREVIGYIRWSRITPETYGYDALQDCICKVMDMMKNNEKLSARMGVSSVSNDGYSESYGSEVTSSGLKESLQSSIRGWLSGTGLIGAY